MRNALRRRRWTLAVALLSGVLLLPTLGLASAAAASTYPDVAAEPVPFGNAGFFGSMAGVQLAAPVVGMVSTPSAQGYWLVASDGGVFSFGDAGSYGSMGGQRLDVPVVGMTSTADGQRLPARGVGRRGVLPRRRRCSWVRWVETPDAAHCGHGGHARRPRLLARGLGRWGLRLRRRACSSVHRRQPCDALPSSAWRPRRRPRLLARGVGRWGVLLRRRRVPGVDGRGPLERLAVGIAATASGRGYWMGSSDGGVFSFGDAGFFGSMGGQQLQYPVTAITATPDGGGARLSPSTETPTATLGPGATRPGGRGAAATALRGRLLARHP